MRSVLGFLGVGVVVTVLAILWIRASGYEGDQAAATESSEISRGKSAPASPVVLQQPIRLPGSTSPTSVGAFPDPIVVSSCSLFPAEEQDVSSQIDGVFQEILVDLGDRVLVGQVLGRLDDRKLQPQVDLLRLKATSESTHLIAKAQHDEANKRVEYAINANKSGLRSVSELEYYTYFYQRERFAREMEKAREEQKIAQKELEQAQHLLDLHKIRSGLTGEVIKVYKRNGEAVKQMEPLFRIATFKRLRVEGFCKVQQADMIEIGMRALVEPEVSSEPLTELRGHTGAITSLVVSPDGRWLASASEDRTVMLWSWPDGVRRALLPHPSEVHAVALIPGEKAGDTGFRLLTGSQDGRVRVWTIPGNGVVEGSTSWSSSHSNSIRALALSPDGTWCATAGEDRRIGIWEVESGKHLYWLGGSSGGQAMAHQGAVTSIHFTPDGHLVSAGRDNLINVWKLGQKEGTRIISHTGRTGEVATLGVSGDGQQILFDHGEELRILRRDDGAWEGSLQCRRQGRFQGLAVFSPSSRMVLAAGSNGRLQLWKAPANPETIAFFRQAYTLGFRGDSLVSVLGLGSSLSPGGPLASLATLASSLPHGQSDSNPDATLPQLWSLHGHEIRHFLTPGTATITCGTFAPDESLVFTGGTDNTIRVWAVPPAGQWIQPREATLTFVGSQVERGTDRVRIRAEMQNSIDTPWQLRPGTYVDLRLYPEAGYSLAGKRQAPSGR